MTWPLRRIWIVGAVLLIVSAWCTEGYFHPDEHFQILEFANWKYGLTPTASLPWEFTAQMRPALQPVLAWAAITAGHWTGHYNPFVLAFILRLCSGLLALYVYKKWAVSYSDAGTKPLFLWLLLACWFMPLLGVRFSSENFAGLCFLLGCCYLIEHTNSRHTKDILAAGFAMGISFCFRFQMAFAIIGVLGWLVFIQKTRWAPLGAFILAGILGVSIGALADRWFYGEWVLTPWNYFRANLLEGKVNNYGVEPFWWYFTAFLEKAIPPLSVLLLLGLVRGISQHKRHLLVWVVVPFIVGHSLIGHKELRFLFPVVVPVLWLAAQGLVGFQSKKWWAPVFKTTVILQIPLLIYATVAPLQSSIGLFRFIWQEQRQTDIRFIAEQESPFRFVGVDVYYYRPPQVQVITVDSFAHAAAIVRTGDILVTQKPLDAVGLPNYFLLPVYRQLPGWMRYLNFNNWQSRTRFWNCYEVGKSE